MLVAGVELPLHYRFAPGAEDDGINIDVPVGIVPSISVEQLNWSVPGMLPALVEHWLRTLPKNKRRSLVPLPDKIDDLCERLLRSEVYRQGRFLAVLSGLLEDMYRLRVDAADWDAQRLPEHLSFFCRVVGEQGEVLASGRDFALLQQNLRQQQSSITSADTQVQADEFKQRGITTLPTEAIPEQIVVGTRQAPIIVYPGLLDDGADVDMQVFNSPSERDRANRRGYARLMLQHLGKAGKFFRRELAKEKQLGLYFSALGSAQELQDQLLLNVIWYCYFENRALPQDAEQFAERAQTCRGDLAQVFATTVDTLGKSLQLRFQVVTQLDRYDSPAYSQSKQDILDHLQRLIPSTVLEQTAFHWLPLLPRYLRGVVGRVENLAGHVPKDIDLLQQLQPLQQRLAALQKSELANVQVIEEVRFLLEELRLKTFTEALSRQRPQGSGPDPRQWKVSSKRLEARLLSEERQIGLA